MSAIRVLVVEDDPAIAGQICHGLMARGYATDLAASGEAAFKACTGGQFDAIVLDRMLPDTHGVELLGRLREAGPVPAVLMLSALGSVEDRVEGLVAGADDYLAKPFDMSELSARLVAICRRGGRKTEDKAEDNSELGGDLTVGRLRLESASHRATFGTEAIELNRKQFSLMAYLMRHADKIVTRAMLIENVWAYSFDPATNIVESNLSRLRTRLQVLGCDPIETRRGEGYVLRADLCK
ncbi:response regulator transcription factor [Novosphingobium terrae]|uniref:response regulator transcription factor n=1 Tax=Novosphingobium terrae TaxID=2726189 RepID=UPI001F12ADB5|nr:response regulator transcription factor [Novosphingobium terrae]